MYEENISMSPFAKLSFDVRTLVMNLDVLFQLDNKGKRTVTNEDLVKYQSELDKLDDVLEKSKSKTDSDAKEIYELLNEAELILNKLKLKLEHK